MRHPDEVELFRRLRGEEYPHPTKVAAQMGMPEGRMYYILDKWERRGWISYGVSIRCFWWCDGAPAGLAEVVGEAKGVER